MIPRDATELLYDSEAALRLVDSAIEDIRGLLPHRPSVADESPLSAPHDPAPGGAQAASEILERGYDAIVSALGRLRESRDALQRALRSPETTVEQLSHASSMLTDVEARLAELASLFDPAALGGR
jgi:hypothetical protein